MRTDIQALRGVAVLLVLFYHAGWSVFSKGYLGVDVFFVISGFLMSGLILRDLDAGTFSFKVFYLRRARRLLPAAYVVLFCVSAAAVFLLSGSEYRDYLGQLLGAITFTCNMVLWGQTGYFGGAAEMKPLLHVWSLSLEEQFYLILPGFLYVVPQRYRRLAVYAVTMGSLALCIAIVQSRPSATFYLLPTRAWELLAGVCCAVAWRRSQREFRLGKHVALIAIAVILLATTYGFDDVHPRLDALLVCLATATVIVVQPSWLNRGIHSTVLARVGDISYSLYLIHWPLFALSRSVWLDGELPSSACLGLLGISFVLAELSYRYVETPFRHGFSSQTWSAARLAVSSTVVMMAVFMALAVRGAGESRDKDWTLIRRPNHGFGGACEFLGDFDNREACSNSRTPEVLVWGDSHAMHWVKGISDEGAFRGVLQATKSFCGPNLYAAPVKEWQGYGAANACLSFNRSVMAFLERGSSIRFAVLVANYSYYFDRVQIDGGASRVATPVVVDSFVRTIQELRLHGVRVVMVAPPPRSGSDLGLCLEKVALGKPFLSKVLRADCSFSMSRYLEYDRDVIGLLKLVEKRADVAVIWPSEVLCSSGVCHSEIGGVPVYRDIGHLSYDGSVAVARSLALGERIRATAR